jgi:hypothetical protein
MIQMAGQLEKLQLKGDIGDILRDPAENHSADFFCSENWNLIQ